MKLEPYEKIECAVIMKNEWTQENGLLTPTLKLKRNVLEKLNAALRFAMQDPSVKQRLADLSSDIPPLDKITPAGLKTHLEAEIIKWAPVIKRAGVSAD